MGKKIDIDTINDLCDCDKSHYCTLKELLKMVAAFEPRFLIQLKCVEIYKYAAGERFHTDIGMEESFLEWTELNYAKLFADIYSEMLEAKERLNPRVIYQRIMERSKQLEVHS